MTPAAGARLAGWAEARPGLGNLRRGLTGLRPVLAGLRHSGTGWILPVGLALVWEALARLQWISVKLLPPPSVVLYTIYDLARTGELWLHVSITLQRLGLGFIFGVLAGSLFGAVTGYSARARDVLDPLLQGLRSVPSIAWVPLFILWFGIFETSKVLLIAVGVFFPVYLNLAGAIAHVDRKLVEVGRVYRFTPAQMVRRILLPAALPTYVLGLRSGLGLGWMFVFAAELMGASEGLGFLMVDGEQTGRTHVILASLLLFALMGKFTDQFLAVVAARFLRWQDSFEHSRSR